MWPKIGSWTDDEEVALHLPRKGADERDPPGVEIRDARSAGYSAGRLV